MRGKGRMRMNEKEKKKTGRENAKNEIEAKGGKEGEWERK
jgi:hypothetical protein